MTLVVFICFEHAVLLLGIQEIISVFPPKVSPHHWPSRRCHGLDPSIAGWTPTSDPSEVGQSGRASFGPLGAVSQTEGRARSRPNEGRREDSDQVAGVPGECQALGKEQQSSKQNMMYTLINQ